LKTLSRPAQVKNRPMPMPMPSTAQATLQGTPAIWKRSATITGARTPTASGMEMLTAFGATDRPPGFTH